MSTFYNQYTVEHLSINLNGTEYPIKLVASKENPTLRALEGIYEIEGLDSFIAELIEAAYIEGGLSSGTEDGKDDIYDDEDLEDGKDTTVIWNISKAPNHSKDDDDSLDDSLVSQMQR